MASNQKPKDPKQFGLRELGESVKACFKGDITFVQRMLKQGMDPNSLHETSGSRLLTAASDGGQLRIVKMLLEAGADPNLQDTWRNMPPNGTALESAAKRGHLKIAKLLVQAGADVNKAGYWPPIKTAASYGQPKMVVFFLEHGATYEPSIISLAVRSGNLEAVRALIKGGVKVNYSNRDGETPLHFAAVHETPEVAKLLVESGAKLDAENRLKETPLHQAAAKGRAKVVEFFLRSGADFTKLNFKKKTPEQWARIYGKSEVADLFKRFRTQKK